MFSLMRLVPVGGAAGFLPFDLLAHQSGRVVRTFRDETDQREPKLDGARGPPMVRRGGGGRHWPPGSCPILCGLYDGPSCPHLSRRAWTLFWSTVPTCMSMTKAAPPSTATARRVLPLCLMWRARRMPM